MLKAFFRTQIRKFEAQWGYNAAYMHDLLDAGPGTFFRFSFVPGLGHSKDAPAAAMAAVGIVGTLAEDCGPCTQISVDVAAANGVKPETLCAILAGDRVAMGETAALGYDFARAVLDRHLGDADETRDEIVRRWGQKAVVALSLALTTARMYPTLKYGLGHGKACSRVTVAGEPAPFHRPELLAGRSRPTSAGGSIRLSKNHGSLISNSAAV